MSDFYALSDAEQAEALGALAREALTQWDGNFADIALVKYRENAVFSALRNDGTKVALRIHRYGYHSDAALWSELHWMQELGRSGIDVPPIIPATNGEIMVHARIDAVPETRQVDMLAWLPGTPIGSAEGGLALDSAAKVQLFHDAGKLAARLHNRTAQIAFPEGFTRHSWCDVGLVSDAPLWGQFWEFGQLDEAERELLLRARAAAREDLAGIDRSHEHFGLIHADFVPENLLHDEGRLLLIDFDDCGYGWHMFELATALYFNLDEPEYPQLRDALFQGYRSERALSAGDEALLPLFMFLRGTTYLGWLQTRPETQTAKELGPMLIERTCALAQSYLDDRESIKNNRGREQ
ncbi:putative protein kinase [Caenibius tardaugens NBRC 16725]|uniref:Aminoglycoside phosphotransferase domain-containing protein n=1 Tax=Caenibius tardaugens NBRC 16725 TaxID=1219035 RepID=U2Y3H6_9SPHN|nr:phosphotransferase [Caenibius tardaugens]AZI37213.1 aminoglycoside phosphotransferase [Caenibius tardaugens NBRC 16725]GAD47541.1 putative protein kinase [Caenibius tardaugens NBRC 16725]